jgi:hypothetical protein
MSITSLFGDVCDARDRGQRKPVLEMTDHLHQLLEQRRHSESRNDLINNFILRRVRTTELARKKCWLIA